MANTKELHKKYANDPDVIQIKQKLEKDKITKALDSITDIFLEYTLKIQEYKKEYGENKKRYLQQTDRIPNSFERVSQTASLAVSENSIVQNFIKEKKEELIVLLN